MGGTGAMARVMVFACIAAVVAAAVEDGLPRPANFPDVPTTIYGAQPELTSDGTPADCSWYGFSNSLFPESTTSECQTTLRAALSNDTANPASALVPFVYYTLQRLIDTAMNASYCYQGCFQLDSTLPSPAPAPAPGAFFRGPAAAPVYWDGLAPAPAPSYSYGPALSPDSDSPGGAPAAQPGN